MKPRGFTFMLLTECREDIRDLTGPNARFYVDTNNNPVDEALRGLTAKQLVEESLWLTGPEFLWRSGPENVELPRLQESVRFDHEGQKCCSIARSI